MDTEQLIATGLQPLQAKAYALLIEKGGLTPPAVADGLKITRTNAYKLLDRLVEQGLAIKKDVKKKITYLPNNPMALTNMVASDRNAVTAREEAVRGVMKDLLSHYYEHTDKPNISVVDGREAVVDAYRSQLKLNQDVYFIRSHADIQALGFDTMNDIRKTPWRQGNDRFGITPDLAIGKPADRTKKHKWHRTWVRQEDYDLPVEWSLCGSTLLIVVFGEVPHAITITDPLVAGAFLQLFKLLDTCLRSMSYYKKLPRSI